MNFLRTLVRLILAMVVAGLLALGVYLGGWWLALDQAQSQVREVLMASVGAEVAHGQPEWEPRWREVAVRLPHVQLVWPEGSGLERLEAQDVKLVTQFFRRDVWRLELPTTWRVELVSGVVLEGRSEAAVVQWQAPGTLRLVARKLSLPEVGMEWRDLAVTHAAEAQAEIQLASRLGVGQGSVRQLSGKLQLPDAALMAMVQAWLANPRLSLRDLARVGWRAVPEGGQVVLENVSFDLRKPQGAGLGVGPARQGAVDGRLRKVAGGEAAHGKLLVSSSPPELVWQWLEAGVVRPENLSERLNWQDLRSRQLGGGEAVRLEEGPRGLLANGLEVGPLPRVQAVLDLLQ